MRVSKKRKSGKITKSIPSDKKFNMFLLAETGLFKHKFILIVICLISKQNSSCASLLNFTGVACECWESVGRSVCRAVGVSHTIPSHALPPFPPPSASSPAPEAVLRRRHAGVETLSISACS